MDHKYRQHRERVKHDLQRRLQMLERRAAHYGLDTPPQVSLEIEDLRSEIADIEMQLNGSNERPILEQEPNEENVLDDTPIEGRTGGRRNATIAIFSIFIAGILAVVFFSLPFGNRPHSETPTTLSSPATPPSTAASSPEVSNPTIAIQTSLPSDIPPPLTDIPSAATAISPTEIPTEPVVVAPPSTLSPILAPTLAPTDTLVRICVVIESVVALSEFEIANTENNAEGSANKPDFYPVVTINRDNENKLRGEATTVGDTPPSWELPCKDVNLSGRNTQIVNVTIQIYDDDGKRGNLNDHANITEGEGEDLHLDLNFDSGNCRISSKYLKTEYDCGTTIMTSGDENEPLRAEVQFHISKVTMN